MTDIQRSALKDAVRELADTAVLAQQPASVRDALAMVRQRRAGRPMEPERVQAFLQDNDLLADREDRLAV